MAAQFVTPQSSSPLSRGAVPAEISDIAAMGDENLLMLTRSGLLYRWDGQRATPVCGGFIVAPRAIATSGDRFVAIGWDADDPSFRRDGAGPVWDSTTLWRSEDRGARCERLPLRIPGARTADGADYRQDLIANFVGGRLVVNDRLGGLFAVSSDLGTHWLRLADNGWAQVLAGPEHALMTASMNARYTLRVLSDSGWSPLAVEPPRRGPTASSPRTDGSLWLADGNGIVAIDPRGTARTIRDEPAFYLDELRPIAISSLGDERFIGVSGFGAVVVIDEHGSRVVARVPRVTAPRLVVDSDRVPWILDGGALYRVTIATGAVHRLDEAPH